MATELNDKSKSKTVSLYDRHWEFLSTQSGGKSTFLQSLLDEIISNDSVFLASNEPIQKLTERYLPARASDIEDGLKGRNQGKVIMRLLDALADVLEDGKEAGVDVAKRLESRDVILSISFLEKK